MVSAYRLIVADGVDLSAEHDGREGEEEEALQTEEDHQQHRHRRREVTALWRERDEPSGLSASWPSINDFGLMYIIIIFRVVQINVRVG